MRRHVMVGMLAVASLVSLASLAGCKRLMGGGGDEDKDAKSAAPIPTPAPEPSGPTSVAQDPPPQPLAAATGAAPSAAPSDAPPPDSAAPADTAPPQTAAPNVPKQPVHRESIDSCCTALNAFAGVPAGRGGHRHRTNRAASLCPGIAEAVRSGRSTRAAGLAQIRAQMGGGQVPASCQ